MSEFIYTITNEITGEQYVGRTNNPEKRWQSHKSRCQTQLHRKHPLYENMRKYGLDNFSFDVLEEGDKALETEYYNGGDFCLNEIDPQGSVEKTKEKKKLWHKSEKGQQVYRDRRVHYICSCGKKVQPVSKARHEKTKWHLENKI